MNEIDKKHKKVNLLIPKLLEQSNKYTKVFKNENKLNNIFTEFEIKSSHHLNFFVKESINRYKNMKHGNNLNKLMSNSEKRRITHANRVLTDNFFSNRIIKQEKKNSKYYTSDKIYKNLKKTLQLLKDSASEKTNCFKTFKINDNMEKTKTLMDDEKESISEALSLEDKLNKGKKEINNVFKTEENKIKKMFDKYKEDVKILQQIGEKSQEKYASIHKKIELALPKLEMFNYVHYEPPKNVEEDVELLQRNTLDKLKPFTKYNDNTYNKRNKCSNKMKDLKKKQIFKKLILNNNINSDLIMNTLNSTKSSKIDMNDTIDVVYNTAYKELTSRDCLNDKRKKLTEILGYDEPKIDNYRTIIKNKFKEIKNRRNEINNEKLKVQRYESMTFKDKLNDKIDNEIYSLTQLEKNLFKMPKKNK